VSQVNDKFEQWCLVELFGHTKLAGLVSEQTIGGQSFVRVDVPATSKQQGFTRLLGNGSIYSMTPMTEELVKAMAEKFQSTPLGVWDLPEEVREAISAGRKLLTSKAGSIDENEPDEFDMGDDDGMPV